MAERLRKNGSSLCEFALRLAAILPLVAAHSLNTGAITFVPDYFCSEDNSLPYSLYFTSNFGLLRCELDHCLEWIFWRFALRVFFPILPHPIAQLAYRNYI
jgi:hypothetical protein